MHSGAPPVPATLGAVPKAVPLIRVPRNSRGQPTARIKRSGQRISGADRQRYGLHSRQDGRRNCRQ